MSFNVIERIIRNGSATIVLFSDGTKSVVRLQDGDADDPEKAVMAAILKRFCRGWQDEARKAGFEL